MVELDGERIPRHVAIIMDGNRRWAKERGLPVVEGHRRVVMKRLEELIQKAEELGIEYITFWAWSTENWGRDRREVGAIMKLFRVAMVRFGKRFVRKGARLKVIGDIEAFPKDIREGVEELLEASKRNDKITVTFALNYGGRDELLRAINRLLAEVVSSQSSAVSVDEKTFSKYLDTVGMPDPDLIIRTSGEQRLSGLMPWQSVYSELYFLEVKMPDFGAEELEKAVAEFGGRKRRFGR